MRIFAKDLKDRGTGHIDVSGSAFQEGGIVLSIGRFMRDEGGGWQGHDEPRWEMRLEGIKGP